MICWMISISGSWAPRDLEKTICAAPTTEVAKGMYGKMPTTAFQDFPLARCIVIWGANPKASNIHLVPYLREAKSRGTFIAVVDPMRNFSEAEVDLHLPLLPGTDLPVALAMIDHFVRTGLLDETFVEHNVVELEPLFDQAQTWSLDRAAEVSGVPAQSIQELAEIYAQSEPALIRCGWGLERNRNGGQAVAAVLALPALLGKFGVRGGGYTMSNSGAFSFDRQQLLGEMDEETRSLNMTQLGRWLNDPLEPPVKSLFVYNANPVATVPDQNAVLRGLSRTDLFTVVFDQVVTDTAAFRRSSAAGSDVPGRQRSAGRVRKLCVRRDQAGDPGRRRSKEQPGGVRRTGPLDGLGRPAIPVERGGAATAGT